LPTAFGFLGAVDLFQFPSITILEKVTLAAALVADSSTVTTALLNASTSAFVTCLVGATGAAASAATVITTGFVSAFRSAVLVYT